MEPVIFAIIRIDPKPVITKDITVVLKFLCGEKFKTVKNRFNIDLVLVVFKLIHLFWSRLSCSLRCRYES